jgi:hypothetical protein
MTSNFTTGAYDGLNDQVAAFIEETLKEHGRSQIGGGAEQ